MPDCLRGRELNVPRKGNDIFKILLVIVKWSPKFVNHTSRKMFFFRFWTFSLKFELPEKHKIWKNLPHGFDKSADLLRQPWGRFFSNYLCFSKSPNFMQESLIEVIRRTFPPIIWIFTEGEGDEIESRLKPFLL